jgi:hypothetical protein
MRWSAITELLGMGMKGSRVSHVESGSNRQKTILGRSESAKIEVTRKEIHRLSRLLSKETVSSHRKIILKTPTWPDFHLTPIVLLKL